MTEWLANSLSDPQVFAASIAAFGVVISVLFSFGISRKNFYLNSITAERTKWIGNLRSNISNISGHAQGISLRIIDNPTYESTDSYHKNIEEIHSVPIRLMQTDATVRGR